VVKLSASLTAAAVIATVAVGTPSTSEARCFGCAVGLGVVAGAIVGSAIAGSAYRGYAPAPGYVVYPGYAAAGPVACPGGYWARRPVAFDAYGRPFAWSAPRFFCPPA
jgi:hypothetical protein